MDITKLTLEVIQQYVGMNNWENVIAFAGVCKSWKESTETYRLNFLVIWIMRSLDWLRQFMFHA